jgi:hypothetical protein
LFSHERLHYLNNQQQCKHLFCHHIDSITSNEWLFTCRQSTQTAHGVAHRRWLMAFESGRIYEPPRALLDVGYVVVSMLCDVDCSQCCSTRLEPLPPNSIPPAPRLPLVTLNVPSHNRDLGRGNQQQSKQRAIANNKNLTTYDRCNTDSSACVATRVDGSGSGGRRWQRRVRLARGPLGRLRRALANVWPHLARAHDAGVERRYVGDALCQRSQSIKRRVGLDRRFVVVVVVSSFCFDSPAMQPTTTAPISFNFSTFSFILLFISIIILIELILSWLGLKMNLLTTFH